MTDRKPTSKKEKRRRLILIFILTMGFAIPSVVTLLLPSLAPSNHSSSGSSTSTSSSTTSSNTSSSSASSSVTSSSTASSLDSSSTSSEAPLGPRLSLLNPVGPLAIQDSKLIDGLEYFIWYDNSQIAISHYSGDQLINTLPFGAQNLFGYVPGSLRAYDEGVIFSLNTQQDGTNTYYYNQSGSITTITNMGIIQTSSRLAGDIYVTKYVNNNPELHRLDAADLNVSTKVLNLSDTVVYYYFSDESMFGSSPIDISEHFRLLVGFDLVNNQTVMEMYDVATYTNFYTHNPMSPKQIVFTDNAIFVSDPMNMEVKVYDINGDETVYTFAVMVNYPYHQGVVISEMMTTTVTLYHQGLLKSTHTNKYLREITNDPDYGSAFVLKNTDNTGIYLYSFDNQVGVVQSGFYGLADIQITNYTGMIPHFVSFNAVADTNVVGYYNQGWTILETTGQIQDGFDTFVTLSPEGDITYGVKIDPLDNADPDAVNIKLYDGRVGQAAVSSIVLEDLNILGLQFLGQINQYLFLNINSGNTQNTRGYIVDVINSTYQALPENIWYMDTTNTSTFKTRFFENNGVIHGFSDLGSITFDIDDIAGTFTTTSSGWNDDSETIEIDIVDNFFGLNDDLLIMFTSPFPNPNNEAMMNLYRGDIAGGMANLTLLTEANIDKTKIYQMGLLFGEDSIYAIFEYPALTIETFEGPIYEGNFYVQNGLIILLDESYEETATNLIKTDAYTPFSN